MKILRARNTIDKVTLLSSTTYRTDYFDRCVYCHKDVENDYYAYKGEIIGMPYRCKCENAKKELKAKELLLDILIMLEKDIEVDRINNVTKHALLNEIERAYEEENECILKDALKI